MCLVGVESPLPAETACRPCSSAGARMLDWLISPLTASARVLQNSSLSWAAASMRSWPSWAIRKRKRVRFTPGAWSAGSWPNQRSRGSTCPTHGSDVGHFRIQVIENHTLWKRAWCGREDSNFHGLPHSDLNAARLPIPPRPHVAGGRFVTGNGHVANRFSGDKQLLEKEAKKDAHTHLQAETGPERPLSPYETGDFST